ncbi:MAG TPA: helix-turn-helix domain-containing protein [bacterium]
MNKLLSLASEPRLAVFRVLVQQGAGGLMAGEIGKRLDMPHSTLSFHLNHLRNAGLVTRTRQSRAQIYTARYDVMNGLIGYLTENCCAGEAKVTGTLASAVALNQKGKRHDSARRTGARA